MNFFVSPRRPHFFPFLLSVRAVWFDRRDVFLPGSFLFTVLTSSSELSFETPFSRASLSQTIPFFPCLVLRPVWMVELRWRPLFIPLVLWFHSQFRLPLPSCSVPDVGRILSSLSAPPPLRTRLDPIPPFFICGSASPPCMQQPHGFSCASHCFFPAPLYHPPPPFPYLFLALCANPLCFSLHLFAPIILLAEMSGPFPNNPPLSPKTSATSPVLSYLPPLEFRWSFSPVPHFPSPRDLCPSVLALLS